MAEHSAPNRAREGQTRRRAAPIHGVAGGHRLHGCWAAALLEFEAGLHGLATRAAVLLEEVEGGGGG